MKNITNYDGNEAKWTAFFYLNNILFIAIALRPQSDHQEISWFALLLKNAELRFWSSVFIFVHTNLKVNNVERKGTR